MIFDSNGFPRDNGATDFMDSARLAGLMKLFNYPCDQTNLAAYQSSGVCYRYPLLDAANPASNNPWNVTRDQIICLTAGLYAIGRYDLNLLIYNHVKVAGYRAQNLEADVRGSKKPWYNGADLMSPADMAHLRLCANLKPNLLGLLWLRLEIIGFKLRPAVEPNQLLAKCVVAGPKYVSQLLSGNKVLKALRTYWAGWRDEVGLAEHIISKLEAYYL
jgi:hypothetical protein